VADTGDPRALGELLRSRRGRLVPGDVGLAAARHPRDPGFAALIARLHRDSELVRQWWPEHDVLPVGNGAKKLFHQRLGPGDYSHVVLQVADNPDQTLVTFSLAPPAVSRGR
jgi:hypothetical protein